MGLLVVCPECKTPASNPAKTWSVISEPSRNGIFSESKVGIFVCSKCGYKFPWMTGKEDLIIVKRTSLKSLEEKLKNITAEDASLKQKTTETERENGRLKEELGLMSQIISVTQLEVKAAELRGEVEALRLEKVELEERLLDVDTANDAQAILTVRSAPNHPSFHL